MKNIEDVEINIVRLLKEVKSVEPEMLMDETVYKTCKGNVKELNELFSQHEELCKEYRG